MYVCMSKNRRSCLAGIWLILFHFRWCDPAAGYTTSCTSDAARRRWRLSALNIELVGFHCISAMFQVLKHLVVLFRDVMKFEFEFDNVRTSNVFSRFEIRRILKVPCCRMRICGIIPVLQLISYVMHKQPESANKLFLKFSLSHKLLLLNVQDNFCSVMCYIVNTDFIDFRK